MSVNQKACRTKEIIACKLPYTADYQNAYFWLYNIANDKELFYCLICACFVDTSSVWERAN